MLADREPALYGFEELGFGPGSLDNGPGSLDAPGTVSAPERAVGRVPAEPVPAELPGADRGPGGSPSARRTR